MNIRMSDPAGRDVEQDARLELPDISYDETLSLGDSVRSRMQFLIAQNGTILNQTQFADAKAGALLTVLGLVAIKGSAPAIVIIQNPLELLSMVMVIVSIGFSLATIMPRFRGFDPDSLPAMNDRYTWLSIARNPYSGNEHGEYARRTDFRAIVDSIANSNVGAARILVRKYMMLRWAFITGFSGCALLLIATNT